MEGRRKGRRNGGRKKEGKEERKEGPNFCLIFKPPRLLFL
jgi:hypothetical protein